MIKVKNGTPSQRQVQLDGGGGVGGAREGAKRV